MAIDPYFGRQLQNCTSSDCMNDSNAIVIGPESNITTLLLLIVFAITMVISGLKLFCVDIPRDRNNVREKERRRQHLIDNRLIKKRVKRLPTRERHDLETGIAGVVPSPRSCRLHKVDLLLPMPHDDVAVDEEELICPICWQDYEENDQICYSPNPQCSHAFHFECIKPWLEKHDRCPVCRSNYLLLPRDEGDSSQSVDTQNRHRRQPDPSLRIRLASAIEEIRRELLENSNVTREVQTEEIELASELRDTSEAVTRETEKHSVAIESSNCSSFDTDLSEYAEMPSLELEMEADSLDGIDLALGVPAVDRIIVV